MVIDLQFVKKRQQLFYRDLFLTNGIFKYYLLL